MKRAVLVMTVLVARVATADTPTAVTEIITDDSFDPDRASQLEGNGVEVRQGLVIHPSVAVQAGATNNVFYSDEDTHDAAFMRVLAGMYFATDSAKLEDLGTPDPNAPEVELTPRTFTLRTGLQLGYQEYLSGDDVVRSQSNLSARALVDFTLFPSGPFLATVTDNYIRDVRSPNLETSNTLDRDVNRLHLAAGLFPGGGTIWGGLYYDNWIEVFENGLDWANRMNQTIGANFWWQWLPVTRVTADVSVGFDGPHGTSELAGMPYKTSSQPLRLAVGVATQITEDVSLKAHVGYARASYEIGEGYSAPIGGAELGYRWSSTGRAVLLYDFDHFDSLNANFYGDTLLAARAIQVYDAFVFDGGPELRLRQYGGIPMVIGMPDRNDTIFSLHVRAQWMLRERLSVSAEYQIEDVHTDYVQTAFDLNGNVLGTNNPSYLRNDFMLGVRAAY